MKKCLLTFWILLLFGAQVLAQSISARFATSIYSWERHVGNAVSETHLRIYQTSQITIGQLAANRLSFHFYGQASQDISESADDDPIPRLYSAYFQWRERKGVVEKVKVGRQRIYSGVAYGTVDGADLSLRLGKGFKLGGFAGLLVPPANEVTLETWDDSHTYGLRASSGQLLGTKVMLSFMQRDRRPVSYASPGRFTQRILEYESLEQRLVGIDAHRSFGRKVSAYGRLDYDLQQERVRRTQVELKVSPTPKLQLAGEFFHRAPLVAANSIFTVFDQSTTQDVGFRAAYRFQPGWFMNANFGFVNYDGDQSVRFGVGFRSKYGYLGYNFSRGYGGQNNGVYASLNYALSSQLGLITSTGLSRYRLFDENADDSTSLTGSLGFNYRAGKHFSIDVLGQGVRNRFLSNDLRIFARANFWIFAK